MSEAILYLRTTRHKLRKAQAGQEITANLPGLFAEAVSVADLLIEKLEQEQKVKENAGT
jgi:hypothetical protein